MQAKVIKDGELYIVHLEGKVDFDSAEPFRKTVLSHLKTEKVVFNLAGLNFVGSNGITPFMETMKELCGEHIEEVNIRFCSLSSEFLRIFEANDISKIRIFENEEIAKLSFGQPLLGHMTIQEDVPPDTVMRIMPHSAAQQQSLTEEPVQQVSMQRDVDSEL